MGKETEWILSMSYSKSNANKWREIAYRESAGGDKALILIHGNMTSSKHWDVLMDKLDANLQSICT